MVLAAAVLMLWTVESWVQNADDPSGSRGWGAGLGPLVCSAIALAIVLLAPPAAQSFLYFQF
jgi:hypothetical protein